MKRDCIAVLILLAIIAGFCHEVWLQGASPFAGDIAVQFHPWKVFTSDMLSRGAMPSWNPHTHGGTPFLANVQSAVLYPFDILLFIFPMEQFFGLSLLLHLWIAAGGAYALARICGASAFPAIIAGLAYGLNGFTMIHIPFGNHLTYAGAAWAPWLFFVITGYVLRKPERAAWLGGVALVTFFHFSCGHPQMLFYSLVFGSLYAALLMVWNARREGTLSYTSIGGWFLLLMAGLALGGLMTSYQLFATLEYLGEANRAVGLSIEEATEFSFAPHRLITLLFPEYYGTHLNNNHYDMFYFWSCAYAGVAVPLLALFLFRPGIRPVSAVPLMAIALLGLFLAWGRGNPIYTLILELPGFGHFRAPAKYLPYFLVPVCVLASLSIERISAEAFARREQPGDRLQVFLRFFVVTILTGLMLAFGMPAIQASYENLRHAISISSIRYYSILIGGLLILATCAAVLVGRLVPRVPRLAITLALGVVLCIDLFTYGRGYYTATLISPEWIAGGTRTPSVIQELKERDSYTINDRVVTTPDIPYPNRTMLWGLNNLAGYDPLSLADYNRMIGDMELWDEGEYHDNIKIHTLDHPSLDMMNVRYIISSRALEENALEDNRLQFIQMGASHAVYERLSDSIAWAWFSPGDNPEAWAPVPSSIIQYDHERIEFQVEVNEAGWVRVAEWFYPGWAAWVRPVEGRFSPHPIEKSPEGLRMVYLEPGTWDIQFIYPEPWGRWFFTILGWLLFGKLVGAAVMIHQGTFLRFIQRLMGRNY